MLGAWSRFNAVLLVLACALSLALGKPWPLAGAAAISFARLILWTWRAWTPSGAFGLANGVTALRLIVILALGALSQLVPAHWLAALVLGLFALDGVDGSLARRRGASSEFGAHFDMETDALLVMTVSLLLFQSGKCGAWVLSAGLWRYAYVLCLSLVPARAGEMPRSRFGRYAFAVLMVGLIAGLALPGTPGSIAAALGAATVAVSFARSFYYSYAVAADVAASS
jgi:phosphatidylglycerophosphate synthase